MENRVYCQVFATLLAMPLETQTNVCSQFIDNWTDSIISAPAAIWLKG